MRPLLGTREAAQGFPIGAPSALHRRSSQLARGTGRGGPESEGRREVKVGEKYAPLALLNDLKVAGAASARAFLAFFFPTRAGSVRA